MKTALRLSPYAPHWILAGLGDVYHRLGQVEQARRVYEHLAERMPGSPVSLTRLACIYGELGEPGLARTAATELLAINPDFTIRQHVAGMPFIENADRERFAALLKNAGLPD